MDDGIVDERTAVGDAYIRGFAVAQVCDAHHGVKWQGAMRRRQLVHVVDFAVGSAASMEGNAVPGGIALFAVRRHCPIWSCDAALRSRSGSRSCSFCRWLATLALARLRVLRSLRRLRLRRLGATCHSVARSAASGKANTQGAEEAHNTDTAEPGHDWEFGGGGLGLRRAAMRASSLLAASLSLAETSRRNSALRRSVSGATSSSM